MCTTPSVFVGFPQFFRPNMGSGELESFSDQVEAALILDGTLTLIFYLSLPKLPPSMLSAITSLESKPP